MPVALSGQRAVVVSARSYPIVLPSVRDPRLHVAAVINGGGQRPFLIDGQYDTASVVLD